MDLNKAKKAAHILNTIGELTKERIKYCCLTECGEYAFSRGCANGFYYAKEIRSEWR